MLIIGQRQVLDNGYVQFIEKWGSDERIIEAARMSTNKGFLGWDPGPCVACDGCGVVDASGLACLSCEGKGSHKGDQKLLSYLYSNHHDTPFEMAGMIIEVKAPIMVFREWHRHRTQSYNEMSARYVPLPNENYLPTVERCMLGSSTNKQAQGMGGALSEERAKVWLQKVESSYAGSQIVYEQGLSWGVPKELARLTVPVARYSKMRASANLRNWLAFLTLRADSKAQWEIRMYANEVALLIKEHWGRTYDLFCEQREEYAAAKQWRSERKTMCEQLEALRNKVNSLETELKFAVGSPDYLDRN